MNNRRQSLFFISLPELQKLCAVKVTVYSEQAATEIRTAQRRMCRQLLFLHQDILSSPVPGTLNQVSVVMTIPFYKSGKFQAYVESHGATMALPERVLPSVFQTCLSYSLITKLASRWNRAGHLLIQGKDFLSQQGKQNAVVMDINVSNNQLCISVEVYTIRLPPPELVDFDISTNVIKKFDTDDNGVIEKCSILSNWCYVLPSMKMGQIINISHVIPSDSVFESYSDLKLYWENLYGYVLPKDPQIYCNIYFKLIGEQLFTYPFSCIRSRPVQYFPRVDLEGVLNAFVNDLKNIIPFICGLPLKMTSKALYATKDLTQSSVQKESTKPANLTGKRNWKETLTQVMPKKDVSIPLSCATENIHQMELQVNQPKPGIFSNLYLGAKDDNTRAVGSNVYNKKQWKKSEESTMLLNSNESFRSSKDSLMRDSTRIIPIFKGKLLLTDKQMTKNVSGRKKQNISQYVPMQSNTAAKSVVFKTISGQLNKPSRNEISVLQLEIGKSNVKSTKRRLKEKKMDNRHLSNCAFTNTMGLDRNSRQMKSGRLSSPLVSASDQSMCDPSTVHQHINKPANLSTGQNARSMGSKKKRFCISHSDINEKNIRLVQNQMQSPTEKSKMNTYRSVHNRAKEGRGQKRPMNSDKDTTNISCHHLQFNSLKGWKKCANGECSEHTMEHIVQRLECIPLGQIFQESLKHGVRDSESSDKKVIFQSCS
ncbi:hypothetical protein JRQ81_012531 [Phrynocephalus forsythii]|uniref:DUF4708 domain-containing protein n=1 Tax=Phrynocephalus forsythii TaxID=171643 RepID=A0A9Q0Y4G2_9SAUR|nr:hypothetical protein JRQ81_012531 [Phrynocephalus forsythii]